MADEEEEGAEKKHEPNERKLQEAGEQGQFARSTDLASTVVLLSAAAALTVGGGYIYEPLRVQFVEAAVSIADPQFDAGSALRIFLDAFGLAIRLALIPLGAVLVGATVTALAQSGFTFATAALEFDFERIDPMAGIERVFALRDSLVELAKGTAKLVFLGAVVGSELMDHTDDLPRLASTDPTQVAAVLTSLVLDVVTAAAPVLIILSIADYAWSWWQFREKMMRTDQQLRDDMKESEGDPRMKGMRRQRQRQIALGQNLKRVAEADVVVTNPTHYAVALRYKRGKDAAPVVVAKGVDHVALKIRAEARRLGIAIVEDRALARALHAKVKPGRAIPQEHFGAVARVLAVIWRRRATRSLQPQA